MISTGAGRMLLGPGGGRPRALLTPPVCPTSLTTNPNVQCAEAKKLLKRRSLNAREELACLQLVVVCAGRGSENPTQVPNACGLAASHCGITATLSLHKGRASLPWDLNSSANGRVVIKSRGHSSPPVSPIPIHPSVGQHPNCLGLPSRPSSPYPLWMVLLWYS